MRRWMSAAVANVVLILAIMPAQAAWKTYVNKELGFSFMAPGEVKAGIGNSRGQIAGPHQTIVYRSTEDGVEYKVTVINFPQARAEGAAILGEREYMFADKKKVLTDAFSHVGSGKDAVYGRKIVVDLPENKGRATGAFFFTNGRLFALEATALPARANSASPDANRFIESISFVPNRPDPAAVELEVPALN
jgi:hypothetical protein